MEETFKAQKMKLIIHEHSLSNFHVVQKNINFVTIEFFLSKCFIITAHDKIMEKQLRRLGLQSFSMMMSLKNR